MLTNRPLAPTTFIASPEDTLAAPDVYEIQSDAVINDLPVPASISNTSDIANELLGGKSMLSSLPGLNSLTSISGNTIMSSEVFANGMTLTSISKKVSDTVSGGSSSSLLDSIKNVGSSMLKAAGGINGIKAIANGSGPSLLTRLESGALTGIAGLASSNLSSLKSVLNNSSMPAQVKQLLSSAIPTTLGAYNINGNSSNRISTSQLSSSYQMGSLINSVLGTNTTSIVDKDATSRLMSGLVMGGMSSGIPNSFSSVLPLAGGDNKIIASVAQAAFKYGAGTGNISALKNVVASAEASTLTGMVQGAIKSFSTNYNPSSITTMSTSDRKVDFGDLSSTLGTLDTKWMRDDKYVLDSITQQPTLEYPVVNISSAREGSRDFATTMQVGAISTTDPDLKYFAMASAFPTLSPEQELQKSFPMTLTTVTSNTNSNNTTLSADQINALDGITINGFTKSQIDAMNGITVT